jgi:hypothetical protein
MRGLGDGKSKKRQKRERQRMKDVNEFREEGA